MNYDAMFESMKDELFQAGFDMSADSGTYTFTGRIDEKNVRVTLECAEWAVYVSRVWQNAYKTPQSVILCLKTGVI